MESAQSPQRVAVLAHFDPDGLVAPHVRRLVLSLCAATDRLIVVSTAPLNDDSMRWLQARTELICRPNTGHDFASYRVGLERLNIGGGSPIPDQLVIINDSAVFPLVDLGVIWDRASNLGADFWGLTPGYEFAPHVQSYFLSFGRSVIVSDAWRDFWNHVSDSHDRATTIRDYEIGLSERLRGAGFRMDVYYKPSLTARLRGTARRSVGELDDALRAHRWRGIAGWLRRLPKRTRHPEFNVTLALADVSVRRPDLLPAVKLSNLRDDPYRLGTPKLLTALEQRHPHAFEGVRDYLERTDAAYQNGWAKAQSLPTQRFKY